MIHNDYRGGGSPRDVWRRVGLEHERGRGVLVIVVVIIVIIRSYSNHNSCNSFWRARKEASPARECPFFKLGTYNSNNKC